MTGEKRKLPNWMSEQETFGTSEDKKKSVWKKNILEDTLPFLKYDGQISYSIEENDCSFLSEMIRAYVREGDAIGFDIEYPVVYTMGKTGRVSLIQLCVSERECYLFHIASMTSFPKGLKRLLEDDSVKKVGVGIEGDKWKLLTDFDLSLKGFVELTDLANQKVKCKEKWSLNGLVKHFFNKQLLKDNSVRCSRWDRWPLSDDQRMYAASDAYAGLLVYQKLMSMDEQKKIPFTVRKWASASFFSVKDKLNTLSLAFLHLMDKVPSNFEHFSKAERAADILASVSKSLKDLRSIVFEASEAQEIKSVLANTTDQASVSGHEVHSTRREDDHRQELDSQNNEDSDSQSKGKIGEVFSMSLGHSEEDLNMMKQEPVKEEHNRKNDKDLYDVKEQTDPYAIDSDADFEAEMLKYVEDLDNSPKSDIGSKPLQILPTDWKDLSNVLEEEDDEGIEEEEDDNWDPTVPQPNAEEIACLKTYFGHSSFKPVQWKVIHSVLRERRDNLVVMATGYGKSLCYQFAPIYTSGIGIVISPLISLMEDQVLQLEMSNIPSCFLGSAQSKNVMQDVNEGKIKVIYMTPEFCSNGISLLQDLDDKYGITLIAIDEAHCISEWGHDFRSAYRNLGSLKRMLPLVPIVALTATASPSIREDILKSLDLRNPQVTCTSFDRPNLCLEVARKTVNISVDLQQFLIKKQGSGWEFEGATIVYCPSRKTSEQVTAELYKLGISCGTYHAGMGIKARRDVHHRFMRDELQCVVATVAFGMGINKPDIRKVIHYGAPKEMESYYQEIGRAGRDGLPSSCHALWAPADINFNRHMLFEIKNPLFRDYKLKMLTKMEKYLHSSSCRRKIILSHFEDKQLRKASSGIMGTEKCCDNCKTSSMHSLSVTKHSLQDFGQEALQLLSAVEALGGKFGTGVPVLFLRGSTSQRVPDRYRLHPLFGQGKVMTTVFWNALARQLIIEGYLQESSGQNKFATTCGLSNKGKNWVSNAMNKTCPSLLLQPNEELCAQKHTLSSLRPRTSMVREKTSSAESSKTTTDIQKLRDKFSYQDADELPNTSEVSKISLIKQSPYKPPEPTMSKRDIELQTTLYGMLVAARQKIASEKDIPPAVLTTNKVLVDMAKMRPTSVENLKKIDGVSEAKANMLAPLVMTVKEFCLTNSLKADYSSICDSKLQTTVTVSKESACSELLSAPALSIYYLFQKQQLSLKKISVVRNISLATVGMYLWQALKAGYPIDVKRAGLTQAIQKTIRDVIKRPPINSDLSSFEAIRALLAPEIDSYFIRMVITLLEIEHATGREPMCSPNKSLQNPTVQARIQLQERTVCKSTLDQNLWIEKKKSVEENISPVQKGTTQLEVAKAPIKLASQDNPMVDEDTEELFSEVHIKTPKRKLPEWFGTPKGSATSSNFKKAKTGSKKGLFG
ncbi:bifunctional 3'-5' exonuclease/ATP-dependent helicase WRN isoform X2 [Mixophyes fleayi]|uniref:bifunctional 3'-5' exonuclease/ATP-dependent helicase WRN isoform X2 n=1 Tax=Mixophyes fleayi TaxID=3061075 RepID=UPI003F4D7D1E